MTFEDAIREKVLVLDGAMGTMIQRHNLSEDDFRGAFFTSASELKGDNECLNVTAPELIKQIHLSYIDAGADIITTNSFGASRISQKSYGLSEYAPKMAEEAARVARAAADGVPRKIWVAGGAGPGGHSLTLPSGDDPSVREYSFSDLAESYREQFSALVKGGVDFILLETCFDALNAKSAVYALEQLGNPVPLVISATISDRSARTLAGQTMEAFLASVSHARRLAAFGINCALGAGQMAPLVSEIASFSPYPVIFYPNAGIPDELGRYNDSPEHFAEILSALAEKSLLNIAGGCCGSTPDHIRSLSASLKSKAPVPHTPCRNDKLTVSGLEAYTIDRSANFTNIGERTNVAGSRKFAGLIAAGDYETALGVAAAQIEGGASVIDINMDDAMLDSTLQMRTFLRYVSSDPAVAKAAVMIDSSHWETICAALENVQGKAIVNSISLKDGEDEFLRRAKHINAMGAAMVVMAFDEEGQATTLERKIEICRRSWKLLTGIGIHPSDIIFDVNVLSIGTGVPEHSRYGIDFIEAVRWIKSNLPGALTSGGISNLSFAFRGNNVVRGAMHSAFLYHAIEAGLDMAIVNPQMLKVYDDIEPELMKAVEDVIFDTDPDATARLVALAMEISAASESGTPSNAVGASGEASLSASARIPAAERISLALVRGNASGLESDLMECLRTLGSAVAVVEGPLMSGMERVGGMFADGKMFLPQVVKSAKVMKEAVSLLEPYLNASGETSETSRSCVVIATVKGDVHDIGKNITATVLQCGGFKVVDLGVMVPCEDILAAAQKHSAGIIAVSGLITPSLARMEELCREMSSRGMTTPLFVGGAAASAVHTAVKLRPLYSNVHYGADASMTAVMAKKCISDPDAFRREEDLRYDTLARARAAATHPCSCHVPDGFSVTAPDAGKLFREEIPAEKLLPFIDWRMFLAVCGVKNSVSHAYRREAERYIGAAALSVDAGWIFYNCRRIGDDIVSDDGALHMPMLRDSQGASLCDFLPSSGDASAFGLFAATVPDVDANDPVDEIIAHAIRVSLADAASAYLQKRFESMFGTKVIMPGIGYSCCPDHSLKRDVVAILDMPVTLTESCSMIPEASVCGLVFVHPDARYPELHSFSKETLDDYAVRRAFSPEDRELFLSSLM